MQAFIDKEIIPQDSLELEETSGHGLEDEHKVHSAVSRVPFFLIHAVCLAAFFLPFHWYWVALAVGMYYLRMFGVTAGYHRYFSHRSYKLHRVSQFLMACLAESSAQKGVLWWASHHRVHHATSDTPEDIHSPMQKGFWWSHVGWVLSGKYDEYDENLIRDFAKFPELRWISEHFLVPPVTLGVASFVGGFLFGGWIGAWSALVWGFFISTVACWHGTYTINSLSHVWGGRRFETSDDSRNNFVLALITMGEGWHNNHHHRMYATRQGLRWYEIDMTYYLLRMMSWVGLAWDLREPREEQKLERKPLEPNCGHRLRNFWHGGGLPAEQTCRRSPRSLALRKR